MPHKDTENDVPPEFYELADRFIELANDVAGEWPIHRVSAAMMFATSRYNAFVACELDPDIASNRDEALDYLCREYRSMLEENLDEHIEGGG